MAFSDEVTKINSKSRKTAIVELLEQHGALSISALADRLGCANATIRRDLVRLANGGVQLAHHHGSVSLVRQSLGSQFEANRIAQYEAKEAIAQFMVEFIPDGITVGLNGGTTTLLVARALAKAKKTVRVVTNAVNIAYELSMNEMEVVVVGGAVRLPNFESTGQLALKTLASIHVDLSVLGAEGADSQFGFSTTSEDEAAVAQAFTNCSDKVLMAVDASKLGKKALFRLLDWDDVDFVAIDRRGGLALRQWPGMQLTKKSDIAQVWEKSSS